MHELETTESYAYSKIENIPDTSSGAYQAGYNFALYFERSARGEAAADEAGQRSRDFYYPKYIAYDYEEVYGGSGYEPDTTTTDTNVEATPEMFADSLFIGDSRVNRLLSNAMLGQATGFAKDGIGNTGLCTVSLDVEGVGTVTLEQLLQSHTYKKIYIANGINQMYLGAKDNFSEFAKLYDIVKRNAPDADIYIQSIIPTSYSYAQQYADVGYFDANRIADYNSRLKGLCDQNTNTYFIDIAAIYMDSNGYFDTAYTDDGLHQNFGVQYLWIDELVRKIKK